MKKPFLGLALVCIILLFTSCELLNWWDKDETPSLSGLVRTTDTAEGVQGIKLTLSNDNNLIGAVVTDEEGKYSFSEIEEGTYELFIEVPIGYSFDGTVREEVTITDEVTKDFDLNAIRVINQSIEPNTVDTLGTASGISIRVNTQNISVPVEIALEEVDQSYSDYEFESKPVRLSFNVDAAKMNPAQLADESVSLDLIMPVANAANTYNYAYNLGSMNEPIIFYTDANLTTYTDPDTGEEIRIANHELNVPAELNFEAILNLAAYEDECDQSLRKLKKENEYSGGSRAIVFIHGLQTDLTKCEDYESKDLFGETFSELANELWKDVNIRSAYSFYSYTYPTNAPIAAAGNDLYEQLKSLNLDDAILVGHSMGGLVSRSMKALHEDYSHIPVITLGTPHDGSVLSNTSQFASVIECTGFGSINTVRCGLGLGIIPSTPGIDDLAINSEFIQNLNDINTSKENIYSIGAVLDGESDNDSYNRGYNVNQLVLSEQSDGVVNISSAIPAWSQFQYVVNGSDHTKIVTSSLTRYKLIEILERFANCTPPPEPPTVNEFALSGGVARESGDMVRVTLNAISIDGEIIENVDESNFSIIENDCLLPVEGMQSTDIGVDLVFIQDLSSSMDRAIIGVRNSVLSFAENLSSAGINIQFASVGYSGNGSIASSPSGEPFEMIGPIQDFTDVNTFQNHVRNEWRAIGGADAPENGLEAIEYAHSNLSWRTGAARVYIDITDISHHSENTTCNDSGPCSDQNLESIVALIGNTSVVHAVAPSSVSTRNANGGLDPWELAEATGGVKLVLPSNGNVNLTSIGIAEAVGQSIAFRFRSMTSEQAVHSLRIRAEINGKVSEFRPESLIRYKGKYENLNN